MPKGVPAAGFRMTKKRMAEQAQNIIFKNEDSKFTINERFEFIEDMVQMLINRQQASMIVAGPGGLGKSHTVIKALEHSGYMDLSILDDRDVGDRLNTEKAFRVIKGYSTTKGLYRTLYENRNGILVMDDTDSIMKDQNSLNLLKAALDSYSRRIISYRADIRDEDLPTTFEFKGSVAFLTNIPSSMLDQALISRSMVVDLTMNNKQKIERMHFILKNPEFMEEFTMEEKKDALDLIESVVDSVKDLSLRTLIQVIRIRNANPNGHWKNLAEYTITN